MLPILLEHCFPQRLRSLIATATVLGLAAAILEPESRVWGTEFLSTTRETPRISPLRGLSQAEQNTMSYAIGDRLKITFFEQLQTELSGEKDEAIALSSLIERPELTGEYLIQQDGNIFLPLLGPINAVAQSHQELEQTLSGAFTQQLKGKVKVSIQLLEREPVYVTGVHVKPGAFKHVPGMTVLHALTLAGGVEGRDADHWRLLDVAREKERLQKSEERLKRLLARTAVLTAEREGKAPVAPEALVIQVGHAKAQQLVSAEERLRALDRARIKGQEEALNKAIIATHQELSLAREKVLQIELRVKEKTERLNAVEALRTRGTTTDANLYLARSELSDARERLHEAQSIVAQLQRKLTEVQHQRTRLSADAEIARELEIKEALNAAAEEEITRTVIGNLLTSGAEFFAKRPTPDARHAYSIIRRTVSGVRRISADEISALLPGDIVQIEPAAVETASN